MLIASILALIALIAFSYSNSLHGPFIYDDRDTILDNPTIRDVAQIGQVLRPPFETPVAGRPIANLTFALNYAAGALDPVGYHAVNIALHMLTAVLLLVIARRATRSLPLAMAIAAAWAVHPLTTDAVNYVSQRTELLMAACALGTLWAAIRAHDAARPGPRVALAWTLCALGMGCKESMVVVPVLVVAFDYALLHTDWRAQWAQRRVLYGGLAATWLILAGVARGARSLSAGFAAHDADALTYLWNQSRLILRYLRLSVWPTDLVLNYGWPQPLHFLDVWPQVALLATAFALTLWALVRSRRLGFLGLWLFVTLAPASSVVPIATEVGAERRMYLPLMAVVALVLCTAVAGWRRLAPTLTDVTWQRPAAATALLVLLSGAVVLTRQRNEEFASSLVLAETTARRYPTPAAYSMYGTELAAAGQLHTAETYLRMAAPAYPPARYYLATVLNARGRGDEAVREFDAFIATQPPQLAQVRTAHLLAADACMKLGRLDDAIGHWNALLSIHADDLDARIAVANALVRANRPADAIPHFERAVAARPHDGALLNGLGVAFIASGRVDDAIGAFERAVTVDPEHIGAHENLARARAMKASPKR